MMQHFPEPAVASIRPRRRLSFGKVVADQGGKLVSVGIGYVQDRGGAVVVTHDGADDRSEPVRGPASERAA